MGKLSGKEQEIIEKYLGGLSAPQIAKEYSVTHQSIDNVLVRNNIKKRSKKDSLSLRFANYTRVSEKLMNKINGWLLGDGSIIHRGHSEQAHFQHGSKHREYIDYVHEQFMNEGIKCNVRKVFSKKSKTYTWCLSTIKTKQFKELRDKWYPGGIKCVPSDLKINSDTMICWIMDDGSLDKIDGILSLHTCSFVTNDCWYLIEKIKEKFGDIKANVVILKSKYPTIRINRISTNKILASVGPNPVKCFNYKWDKIVRNKDFSGNTNKDFKAQIC